MTWKVSSRLTLNLGAEYDYERTAGAYLGHDDLAERPPNHPSDKNNVFATHCFACEIRMGRRQVTEFRGGYGVCISVVYE